MKRTRPVTKTTDKSDELRAKIDASAADLRGDKAVLATRLPDADPPEQFSSLIGEYPGLAIAAGLGLGLLAGAILPRNTGRKLARGVFFLASTGGELGLVLGKQALTKVDDATRDSREKLTGTAMDVAHKAADVSRDVASKAADAGRKAGHVAGDASERARDLGLGLVKVAIDAASRLRH